MVGRIEKGMGCKKEVDRLLKAVVVDRVEGREIADKVAGHRLEADKVVGDTLVTDKAGVVAYRPVVGNTIDTTAVKEAETVDMSH